LYAALEPSIPASWRFRLPGDKIEKAISVLESGDPDALYQRLVSLWNTPDTIVVDGTEPPSLRIDQFCQGILSSATERMMLVDLLTYLPDDILVKVDRASMAVSLEARAPLLDHRIVEWALGIPLALKTRHGRSKWVLRQVLYRYVPPELIDRPKMGFAVPLDTWLRGPLRDWAEALLDEERLKGEGFFQAGPIRAAWREHLSGSRNAQYPLWAVLMFQSWREAWNAA
jgi:asparagine synthase (glutamine-hydrolysing)